MERLYSSQKTFITPKSFALKPLLTISLFLALFTLPEVQAQNVIICNTSSTCEMHREHISTITILGSAKATFI